MDNTKRTRPEGTGRSSSWPEQIIKYAALLTLEELHKGPREQLGLLFIVPESAIESHWKKCGLKGASFTPGRFLKQH